MTSLVTDLKYRFPARYLACWGALVLLAVIVAIVVPVTFNPNGIKVVTSLAGVLALASMGQMLIVMLGAIDLSVPAIIMASAGIVVHFGTPGASLPPIVLLALAVAVVISLGNWVFITRLGLNSIITTLATLGIVTGAMAWWTGVSFSLTGRAPEALQTLANRSVLNLSASFLVALVVAGLLALVLSRTRGGRQLAAIGTNRRAARFQGVRVVRIEFTAFAAAGLLYGIAGVLVAGIVGSPDTSIGAPYQLATITAVAIAGTAFSGGPASVASVVGACVFLQLLDQALTIHGLAAGPRVVAQGVALVVAISAITLGQYALSGLRWSTRSFRQVAGSDQLEGLESSTQPAKMKETR
ncbi:ABC transporter permease [Nocardioides pocheonensis]|uniref:ABC transporter permease n=1 Tax=Nocardioides pocheonensis TaxID=661485 RepID=UPI00161A8B88|nr:ABC transporter permease [Nocardioides pocheonensis]